MTSTVLPRLSVVEASAGTGKTHRITELVAHHVVHGGVPIERILVVTFTRAATAELRDRIRRRLVELSHDPLLDADRLAAARRAVVSFDLASIATIHGFCHQALAVLDGTVVALREGLVSDDTDLRNEVVNDAVLAEVADRPDRAPSPLADLFTADKPALTEQKVRDLVRTMLTHPAGRVHLAPTDPDADAAWAGLLASVRDRVLARRTAAGVLTHDDVIRRTREAVLADAVGRRDLAARYQLVLVDEFQDTDAQQWDIIRHVFLADDATTEVVVVGDPKQAIYSFRGADVHAYLVAREAASGTDTLHESWRMEPGLITATNLLFRGSSFGDGSIAHQDLDAPIRPADQRVPRLVGDPLPAEITIRVVPDETSSKKDGPPDQIAAPRGRAVVAADVADTVVQLLETPGRLTPATGEERTLRPSDIAVLVGKHDEAELVGTALAERGVRCVQRGTANVADSPAAQQWRWVLDAMQRPAAPSSAALAALSWFVGWSPDQLASATDDELVGVQELLVEWRRTLAHGGVPAFTSAVRAATGLIRRLLDRPDGERAITDLDHLAELLHAAVPDTATPDELLDVLDALATDADALDERITRRIDSDDDAVQLLTVHASKGLQFPITLVPFLWTTPGDAPATFHEGHELCIDATIGGRDDATKALSDAERQGTDARLAYVALTRAQHRLVVWWATVTRAPDRPLGRLLLHRTADGDRVDATLPKRRAATDEVVRRLEVLRTASKGRIRGQLVAPAQQRMPLPGEQAGELAVRRFERDLPRGRARHSFTSLVAGVHAVPVVVATAADDEPDDDASAAAAGPPAIGPADRGPLVDSLARLDLAGTEFGTAVHEVFEALDFAASDPAAEVGRVLDRVWPWRTLTVERGSLVDGLAAVLASPTGPHLDGRPLASFGRRDRLDELSFELPLATSGTPPTAADVARLVGDHVRADHPLRPVVDRLLAETHGSEPFAVDLRGHLTGSIDLVLRVAGAEGPRFVVCDYKTNRLAPVAGEAALAAYAPERLWPAMAHHHYALQAILYGVALHRYLRWRLPGYHPGRHLGGAAYLFVRGMAGPATPHAGVQPYGVCSFDVPADLTVALSDLLDGSRP